MNEGNGADINVPFEVTWLSDRSDSGVIAELRRVAALVDGALTRERFDQHARISASAVRKRFGGWEQALAAAGLANRYCGPSVTAKMRAQGWRSLSDDELLAQLTRIAATTGRGTVTKDDWRKYGRTDAGLVRRRFGSWSRALQLAGLRVSKLAKRYTDADCYENLTRVWTYYGRVPQHDEMKRAPSIVGPKAYVLRWGTWRKALEAFVAWAAEPDALEAPKVGATPSSAHCPAVVSTAAHLSVEERHEIPLRLRFKVLQRDHFKCVLCGRSPAKDHSVELHVDHTFPHSRGGRTIIENLRTTCAECNLGKGNLLP